MAIFRSSKSKKDVAKAANVAGNEAVKQVIEEQPSAPPSVEQKTETILKETENTITQEAAKLKDPEVAIYEEAASREASPKMRPPPPPPRAKVEAAKVPEAASLIWVAKDPSLLWAAKAQAAKAEEAAKPEAAAVKAPSTIFGRFSKSKKDVTSKEAVKQVVDAQPSAPLVPTSSSAAFGTNAEAAQVPSLIWAAKDPSLLWAAKAQAAKAEEATKVEAAAVKAPSAAGASAKWMLVVLPIAAFVIYAYWSLNQAEEIDVVEEPKRKALCLAKFCLQR